MSSVVNFFRKWEFCLLNNFSLGDRFLFPFPYHATCQPTKFPNHWIMLLHESNLLAPTQTTGCLVNSFVKRPLLREFHCVIWVIEIHPIRSNKVVLRAVAKCSDILRSVSTTFGNEFTPCNSPPRCQQTFAKYTNIILYVYCVSMHYFFLFSL